MTELPHCPQCQSEHVYQDRLMVICPECGHEWAFSDTPDDADVGTGLNVVDANGTPLADGDIVAIIKDLKVKGMSTAIKIGTKVKNIRLIAGDHNIDCKIPGFGDMQLKSEFVKKLVG